MDIVVSIPKELEPVVAYWEKRTGVSMAAWLTDIAVGNLKSEASVAWEEVAKPDLDTMVKAVDWTTKVAALSAIMEPIEESIEEKGLPDEVEP